MLGLYALLLMVSGALLLAVGGGLSGQSKLSRVLNVLFGLGFLGYGFYLEFLFKSGTYRIFLYAFVVPVLLLVNTFKARKAAKDARQRSIVAQPPAETPAAH